MLDRAALWVRAAAAEAKRDSGGEACTTREARPVSEGNGRQGPGSKKGRQGPCSKTSEARPESTEDPSIKSLIE